MVKFKSLILYHPYSINTRKTEDIRNESLITHLAIPLNYYEKTRIRNPGKIFLY
ncbi:hypothetical protein Cst_c13170 [Thermoclostridium stercorarium subsp. stercorarium DSM 8532]|uniref:Uncharacterized protein n=1 Tax=Thermoclostridium stercorarium (strain ATCC 35414 / DSM 8532 / NCIMB 11754) TaxID=1121335 RepID=L7VRW3_THES1|nr:hypothetical protein Cst_c13170 [Thermoclostridium stercorarium subsp. stercorarium DSM 8532]